VIGVHRGIHSNRILPGTVFVNGSRWSSPETDALMDAATVATDAAARSEAYQKLVPLVTEASPVAYVLELNYPTVLSTQFADVITSPIGIYGNYAFAHQR
jgi:peptide/nickel transport system substrate-binding protein